MKSIPGNSRTIDLRYSKFLTSMSFEWRSLEVTASVGGTWPSCCSSAVKERFQLLYTWLFSISSRHSQFFCTSTPSICCRKSTWKYWRLNSASVKSLTFQCRHLSRCFLISSSSIFLKLVASSLPFANSARALWTASVRRNDPTCSWRNGGLCRRVEGACPDGSEVVDVMVDAKEKKEKGHPGNHFIPSVEKEGPVVRVKWVVFRYG